MKRLALILALTSATLLAQTPATSTFDVASVKRSTSDKPSLDITAGGRFSAIRVTLRDLINLAYSVGDRPRNDYQLVGGPDWVGIDRFDVLAVGAPLVMTPPSSGVIQTQPSVGLSAISGRLRQLLADRFKLDVHHEARPLPVYALTRVRSDTIGPRLRRSKETCCGGFKRRGEGSLTANAVTMEMLVAVFSGFEAIGRIVEDRSGLSGAFDLELTWAASPNDAPSIFTAVQEQLGLKLERATGPVDVLVIDHIDRPTEN
jgi:uncharacterized protein (TIGR03435 family)